MFVLPGKASRAETVIVGDLEIWVQLDLGLAIGVVDTNVRSRLLAGEEEETIAADAQDCRAHDLTSGVPPMRFLVVQRWR
jgi:hypothetical protein